MFPQAEETFNCGATTAQGRLLRSADQFAITKLQHRLATRPARFDAARHEQAAAQSRTGGPVSQVSGTDVTLSTGILTGRSEKVEIASGIGEAAAVPEMKTMDRFA
ncbi:hypothetical protein ACPOLB_00220 [Rubrivivax sp. RP6-9]|uniref:hypothetical protein n=1 Tax=Rubrivivax sp. RP6-9 TaxID=3415750 RepID=UPI003CC672DB